MRRCIRHAATPDVLLDVGAPAGDAARRLPWQTFEEMLAGQLRARCRRPRARPTRGPTRRRRAAGGERCPPALAAPAAAVANDDPAPAVAYAPPQFDGDAAQFPLHFLPYPSSRSSTARWRTCRGCRRCRTRSPRRCGAAGSRSTRDGGDARHRVKATSSTITSSQGTLQAAAIVSPGIAPDVVAMPVGQGHTTVHALCERPRRRIRSSCCAADRSDDRRVGVGGDARQHCAGWRPDGRLILFAGGMREHEDEPDRGFDWSRRETR